MAHLSGCNNNNRRCVGHSIIMVALQDIQDARTQLLNLVAQTIASANVVPEIGCKGVRMNSLGSMMHKHKQYFSLALNGPALDEVCPGTHIAGLQIGAASAARTDSFSESLRLPCTWAWACPRRRPSRPEAAQPSQSVRSCRSLHPDPVQQRTGSSRIHMLEWVCTGGRSVAFSHH